ncbi:SPOR domain-containing protein [Paenibacillus daejeonensis]|uniref:SPOR domain-containing protein n=1 Tax=Paenibacillus daejeonensis TaxID=135193 RepID=UPI00035E4BAD|nr:SPOR domain-containing protein [Paenibacillus daejeonensis]
MSQKARITYRFDNPPPKPVRPLKERDGITRASSVPQREILPRPVIQAVDPVAVHTNGKEEEKTQVPLQEQLTFTREQDLPPWVSPFQDDAFALERLIRESDPLANRYTSNEIKGEQRQEAGHQPYIELGEREVAPRVVPALPQNEREHMQRLEQPVIRRHPVGPSWLKVFASVAGAIATGALFGYMVLSLFSGETVPPVNNSEVPAAATSQGNIAPELQPDGAAVELPPVNEDALTAVSVAGSTYYMLQYGVFSNEEGMLAALGELRQKGLAAASSKTDGYRVFAGMGTNRNSAVLLSEQLGNSEVYLKEITVPEVSRLPFLGDAREAEQFFEQTGDLIRLFNELTLTLLSQEQPERLQERDVQVWRTSHQQWTASAAAIAKAWDDSAKGPAELLVTQLQTAAVSMEEYDKHPSRAHLWTAQTALMEAVIIQKEWLAQIDALS